MTGSASSRYDQLSAIAMGAFAGKGFPALHYSVWEGQKHRWVAIQRDEIEHYG